MGTLEGLARKAMRSASSSVAMPFSVTTTGRPLTAAARRTVCSTAWGQRSSPIWVSGTSGSFPARPSGPKCMRV